MFKEKVKEVLELVLEVGEKTNSYVNCGYDTRSKILMIVADKEVLTMSDCEYQQEEFEEIQNYLKELITEGNTEQ